MKVSDAMTQSVETIAPSASLKDAAELFDRRGIGGAPVMDVEGEVIGVLTDKDIVLKDRGSALPGFWRRLLQPGAAAAEAAKAQARTVAEAMSAPAITANARWSLADVADVMIEHDVNRLPVLENDRLVGIITRHDLVRAFARGDDEIEREILNEAFAGLVFPEQIAVEVQDGSVTLRGEVDSTYDAEVLPRVVRRVPGVVEVDSKLQAWDIEKQQKVTLTEHRA